jgi:hypothetical protein
MTVWYYNFLCQTNVQLKIQMLWLQDTTLAFLIAIIQCLAMWLIIEDKEEVTITQLDMKHIITVIDRQGKRTLWDLAMFIKTIEALLQELRNKILSLILSVHYLSLWFWESSQLQALSSEYFSEQGSLLTNPPMWSLQKMMAPTGSQDSLVRTEPRSKESVTRASQSAS